MSANQSGVRSGLYALAVALNTRRLVHPVAPWNEPKDQSRGISSPGKVPVRLGVDGRWYAARNWNRGHGLSVEELRRACDAGANGGVLLGVVAHERQYIALDLDLGPKQPPAADDKTGLRQVWICRALLRMFLRYLAERLGQDFWIRYTENVDWRCAILFQMVDSVKAGHKKVQAIVQEFTTAIPPEIGKAETLAQGSQLAAAGMHWTGNRIVWCLASDYRKEGASLYDAPVLSLRSLPLFVSRDSYDDAIDSVFAKLSDPANFVEVIGKVLPKTFAFTTTQDQNGQYVTVPPAEDRAPPSAGRLIHLLNRMTNTAKVDRGAYVNIMRAVVSCLNALHDLKKLSDVERKTAEEAAIDWAARWEAPPGHVAPGYQFEYDKFYDDFNREQNIALGWRQLVYLAETLCDVPGIGWEEAYTSAQHEFVAVEDPPPPDEAQQLREEASKSDVEPDPFVALPRDATGIDFKAAELQIARWLINMTVPESPGSPGYRPLKGAAVYSESEKRWLVWRGRTRGWDGELANKYVQEWIEHGLYVYLRLYNRDLGNNDDKKARMLSQRQLSSLERLIRTELSISASQIDAGRFCLQTPKGAFDLRAFGDAVNLDAQRMSDFDQIRMHDTRLTSVAPEIGATPLFDGLLWLLCGGDVNALDYLWAYLGYTLLGEPFDSCFLVLHGPGGTGKSVLMDILRNILGSYAITLDRSVILDSGKQRHPTDLYAARGKRLWCVSELPPEEKWNEERLKAMTGGDRLTARGMHQNAAEFQPEGSFLIVTNHVPRFYRISNAIVRRVRMIYSRKKPEVVDTRLKDRILKTEGGAILRRLMLAARRVHEDGKLPIVPDSMISVANRYLHEQDTVYAWFSQECEECSSTITESVSKLRESYERWAKERAEENGENDDMMGLDITPLKGFFACLRAYGAVLEDAQGKRLRGVVDGQRVYVVQGIRLKSSK